MKLQRGVAVGVCVGTMLYLYGRRSCGVTEGATGGRNSRVCGDVGGGTRGWIVRELGVRITGGSGHGGWLGIRIICRGSEGGLQMVVGTVVGGWIFWLDCLWALCRIWHSWTEIAGNNRVGIIIVFIIREDLEGVVVPCQTLVYDR
jgi:hypothetical protein